MNKGIRIAAVALGMLGVGLTAEAVPITGFINFSGSLLTTGGTGNLTTATGLNFVNFGLPGGPKTELGGTGSYSPVAPGVNVNFTDFTFAPFSGPLIPLWTFTDGGLTYSFDLTSVSYSFPVVDTQTFLLLSGAGNGHITGFDDTPLEFSLSVQTKTGSIQRSFSFSATNSGDATAVPEPATLLLLGSGLTGLALRRRRRG